MSRLLFVVVIAVVIDFWFVCLFACSSLFWGLFACLFAVVLLLLLFYKGEICAGRLVFCFVVVVVVAVVVVSLFVSFLLLFVLFVCFFLFVCFCCCSFSVS